MSDLTRRVHRLVREASEAREQPVELPLEAPLHMEVNGVRLAMLMRLPGHDRELALGFWLTDGLISGRDDVATMYYCPDDPNVLRIRLTREVPERRAMAIGTACGGILGGELPEPVPMEGSTVPAGVLMGLPAKLQERQPVRRRVGVLHGAGTFTHDGTLVGAYEDVGRHNAMDKALGHCVLRGEQLGDKIVVITGRGSAELVIKAARARIPILCSTAMLTSLGAELAEQLGLTLVARLRHDHLEVFSHPERVA